MKAERSSFDSRPFDLRHRLGGFRRLTLSFEMPRVYLNSQYVLSGLASSTMRFAIPLYQVLNRWCASCPLPFNTPPPPHSYFTVHLPLTRPLPTDALYIHSHVPWGLSVWSQQSIDGDSVPYEGNWSD